jgi:hypothetical protein
MSLFHVIKYHISCPPTAEEVMALPTEVIDKWIGEFLVITGEPEEGKAIHRERRVKDGIRWRESWMSGEVSRAILYNLIKEYEDPDGTL